jgi:hypothetical protein
MRFSIVSSDKEESAMKQVLYLAVAAAIISVVPTQGHSAGTVEVAGVAFASRHETGDGELALRGQALLRYMIFIKAYAGAFYLPAEVDRRQALGTVPRRLELSYFHAISAADFAEATRQKVADNVAPEALAMIEERLQRFNALYRDVQPGDRYALTYLPGQGTELALNGQSLGRIAGDDFAAAIFAIWLGSAPIDESFKKALLGES